MRLSRGRSAVSSARRLARTLLLGVVPVGLMSSVLVFLLTTLTQGNPAAQRLGESATPAAIARLNDELGLNRPLVAQYVHWLTGALSGHLGNSYISGESVSRNIIERVPVDLSLAIVALGLGIFWGFTLGIIAAVRRGGRIDRTVTAASVVALAIPDFWLAIVFVSVFAVSLSWLPSSGYVSLGTDPVEWARHIILPGVAVSLAYIGMVARQLRTSLVAALEENYIVGARMRGLSASRVLFGHALRNAAGPALVVVGLAIPQLFGSAVIAETVFALPGLGQYALAGAESHDVPVIQGVLLVSVAFVMISNLSVDALLGWLHAERGRR